MVRLTALPARALPARALPARALLVAALGTVGALGEPARAEMACENGPRRPAGAFAQRQVAGSGGVIVGANELPDWRFRDVNRRLRPRVAVVAPGLAIYYPPPVADPQLSLEDPDLSVQVRLPRDLEADPPLAAPAVRRVRISDDRVARSSTATVELAGKVPEHAILAVIARIEGTTERTTRTPLAWVDVRSGSTSFTIWHSPKGCEPYIDATIAPRPAETVEIRWLDDSGRISEPSAPVTTAMSW